MKSGEGRMEREAGVEHRVISDEQIMQNKEETSK